MIEVEGISKSFGRVRAVRGVSFRVGRGEVVGLLGANGAGKTTTLRIITGFLPPDSGRAMVAGHDTVEESREARRAVGYLPESAPAYPEMRTVDYLDFRARLYGLDRDGRRRAVGAAVERCGLGSVRRRRIGHLSKGYRQRVGLAATLLHDPAVLVLDEPTNGLDPGQIREARSLIRELAEDRTVIVSSHILPEIELTCDRVVIMASGRVRADSRIGELGRDGGRTYLVELKVVGERDVALGALRSVEGVVKVEEAGGTHSTPGLADEDGRDQWVRMRVEAERDVREGIARAAAGAGLVVRELRAESPTLERLFLEIMETDGGEGR